MLVIVDELLAAGEIVAGKYRVEELVGEGAMGRVYRARHLLLGRNVALKVLRASVEGEERRTRFVREAKATMGLRSEHVVRVYDLGVLSTNTPYMVLEYLEGTDLRTILAERGSLPAAEAVDYVLQACEGLAEAHLAGIVHRDLKPQNLFLTRRPNGSSCVKLLDFGVSKFGVKLDSLDELTMSHVLLGSPIFMSPEQIRDSRKVDARRPLVPRRRPVHAARWRTAVRGRWLGSDVRRHHGGSAAAARLATARRAARARGRRPPLPREAAR